MITPINLPQLNPSLSDCSKLQSYTIAVIRELESTLSILNEVSAYPDEAMILVRRKVETMIFEAEKMRLNLNSIEAEAANKTILYNQSQTM